MPLHDVSAASGDWLSFAPAGAGFASKTSDLGRYCVIGRTCFVYFDISGTSNATTFTFTAPIPSQNPDGATLVGAFQAIDNGTTGASPGMVQIPAPGSSTIGLFLTWASGGWTASGTKRGIGSFFYEI